MQFFEWKYTFLTGKCTFSVAKTAPKVIVWITYRAPCSTWWTLPRGIIDEISARSKQRRKRPPSTGLIWFVRLNKDSIGLHLLLSTSHGLKKRQSRLAREAISFFLWQSEKINSETMALEISYDEKCVENSIWNVLNNSTTYEVTENRKYACVFPLLAEELRLARPPWMLHCNLKRPLNFRCTGQKYELPSTPLHIFTRNWI